MFCLMKKKRNEKEFKIKSINQEHMKLTKYLCHVLKIKDMCQMMEFVRWLISIKIVSEVVEIKQNCDKKDCNKEARDN